jgi:hypothetical protein
MRQPRVDSIVRLPVLDVPFPLGTNPATERAERHGRDFVRRFGLISDEAALAHHDGSLLGSLIGHAYPEAAPADLELVTDWIGCNLVLDDLFDETELGRHPDRMREYCRRVIGWLPVGDEPAAADDSPFAAAYADLWRRARLVMSRGWCRRFVGHFESFLDCCCWEAENRLTGRIPSPRRYRAMRGRALMPYLDLIELTRHAEIPDEVYRLPAFTELNQALSDAVLWTNDMFSCEKEELLGDVHNLVTAYRHADGMSMQEAVDLVGVLIQDRINEFAELADRFVADQVPGADGGLRDQLSGHLSTMRAWLRGQLEWRYETYRFSPDRVRAGLAGSDVR